MADEQQFIYDLVSELRRSPGLRNDVSDALRRVDTITQAVSDGKAPRSSITEAEAALVPLCGFNFGLLIPRFFPRYPVDTPLDFSNRPFMFSMTAQAPGSVITLKAGRQVGKCTDGDTLVETPDGHATLRDLFDEGIPV